MLLHWRRGAREASERYIGGATPREVVATIPVLGAIDNRPKATQDVVFDPVVRSKKHLVEATAFLELAPRLPQNQWIVCGMETHVCVYQTARDLAHRGDRGHARGLAGGHDRGHDRHDRADEVRDDVLGMVDLDPGEVARVAGNVGDQQTVKHLRPFKSKRNCSFSTHAMPGKEKLFKR